MDEEGAEAGEAGYDPGEATQAVVTQDEGTQLVELTQLIWDCLQQIASQMQDLKAARNEQ